MTRRQEIAVNPRSRNVTYQAESCDAPDLELVTAPGICDKARLFQDRDDAANCDVPGCDPVGELVLSLFPGIDLLGRAFREVGFVSVTGPDVIFGDDVRTFRGLPGRFSGIIGGPPCQDFSCARQKSPTYDGYGVEMLQEFLRIVDESQPEWFLIENVPAVPDVCLDGYKTQRLDITDAECGGVQRRNRHIQFGHRDGWIIRPHRLVTSQRRSSTKKCVMGKSETTFAEACRRQGLPERLQLPGWSRAAKHQAIGNAVSMHVGRTLAEAVTRRGPLENRDCGCLCGRTLKGKQKLATAACRKRMERRRSDPKPVVSLGGVTWTTISD